MPIRDDFLCSNVQAAHLYVREYSRTPHKADRVPPLNKAPPKRFYLEECPCEIRDLC